MTRARRSKTRELPFLVCSPLVSVRCICEPLLHLWYVDSHWGSGTASYSYIHVLNGLLFYIS